MSQLDPSQHSILSPEDAFAKVFGTEHPSRVRGLGMGVCPTNVFGNSSQRFHSNSSSGTNLASQEEVQSLRTELAETKGLVRAILDYIKVMGGSIPPHIFN